MESELKALIIGGGWQEAGFTRGQRLDRTDRLIARIIT